MDKKTNLELMMWEKNNKQLLKDMDEWRERYNHRTPCKEYKKHGFCKHLVKARTRKFRKKIKEQVESLLKVNYSHLSKGASVV